MVRHPGVLIWMLSYCGLGYAFSDQIETVGLYAMQMGRGAIVLLAALLAAWILWKFIQRQRFLESSRWRASRRRSCATDWRRARTL